MVKKNEKSLKPALIVTSVVFILGFVIGLLLGMVV